MLQLFRDAASQLNQGTNMTSQASFVQANQPLKHIEWMMDEDYVDGCGAC